MRAESNSEIVGDGRKLRSALLFITRPQLILFLAAVFNFIWYFSQSSTIYHFGSKGITFCLFCPWYWDWSITNPPSLLLVATLCMLFRRWKGYLAALLVSSYVVVEGINWVSAGSGFLSGIALRIDAISQNEVLPFWMALDWQYLFALAVSAIALIYLISAVRSSKHLI